MVRRREPALIWWAALAVAMVVAAWLGVIGIVLGGPRLRAAIGLSALFLAMLLGGP